MPDSTKAVEAKLPALQSATAEIAGPRGSRTTAKIAYERADCKTRIGDEDSRCYSIGLSLQRNRSIDSPHHGAKIREGQPTPDQEKQLRFLQVRAYPNRARSGIDQGCGLGRG